jgi:hypothetical protein
VIEREKILLEEYGTIGALFYVIKVKTYENGSYVIKIGESRRGITDRYKEHKSKYDECLLLDCFVVKNSKDFETFIKEHELIRVNKVKDLPGHESELELFLIGKNLTYQTLLNIVNNNIKCKVKTYNETTNEIEFKNVNNRFKNGIDINETEKTQWYQIDLNNGKSLKVTGNHRIYLPRLKCWRRVDELTENDVLMLE